VLPADDGHELRVDLLGPNGGRLRKAMRGSAPERIRVRLRKKSTVLLEKSVDYG
jgi:hypothetical protein